ncbi:hypothetical protein, partial [Sphingopyxis soli]|uniref:hypothetical protein n=1 Tax=Sphingopyxis soli TaxID=592051 RepID=UPI001BFE02A2
MSPVDRFKEEPQCASVSARGSHAACDGDHGRLRAFTAIGSRSGVNGRNRPDVDLSCIVTLNLFQGPWSDGSFGAAP